MLDVAALRNDFPILSQEVYGRPLVYLDNGATTQVPECVLERVTEHYRTQNGNVHRGVHFTANASTHALEAARHRVARFVNAASDDCIVFTRGTTESLNTVAFGLREYVGPGDHVVVTVMEHHSNFVPWQQLCAERGATFHACDVDDEGNLKLDELAELMKLHPKVVSVSCCSNVLGTVNPIERICAMAHEAGALAVLDGAQIMRHRVMDVQAIDCDFLAFSGHKMMAGTGIGALYGKSEALALLRPCQFGGEMVDKVTVAETTFGSAPLRFEAGTPNYVGSIALAAAMDYLEEIGRTEIATYEDELVAYAAKKLHEIDGVNVLGNPAKRAGCVSFTFDGAHPFDVCTLIDKMGVALRSGHACAEPLLTRFGLTSVARLSPAFYNTFEEIDYAVSCIKRALDIIRAAG